MMKKVRLLVVGDAMLDTYVHGSVERLSPEAPVPVVRFEQKTAVLGGAANVAHNAAALGARVTLAGVVGNDAAGKALRAALKKATIKDMLVADAARPTTEKQRIVVLGYQQIVRVDFEETAPLAATPRAALIAAVRKALPSADVLVLSDYAKGVCAPEVLRQCIMLARKARVPLILNPKPHNAGYLAAAQGATLIVLNCKEGELLGGNLPSEKLVQTLSKKIGSVLLTLGEGGMLLSQKGSKPLHFPALTKGAVDVSGAGDTVVAVCALVLGAGGSMEEAARLASRAAGVVVRKPGTATLTVEELHAA